MIKTLGRSVIHLAVTAVLTKASFAVVLNNWVYVVDDYYYYEDEETWYAKESEWDLWSYNFADPGWQNRYEHGWYYMDWPIGYAPQTSTYIQFVQPRGDSWVVNTAIGQRSLMGRVPLGQATQTTQQTGSINVETPELRDPVEVRFLDAYNNPVAGIDVQWRARNGRMELVAYSPDFNLSPTLFRGNPAASLQQASARGVERLSPQDTVEPQESLPQTGVLVIPMNPLVSLNLDYEFSVFELNQFKLESIAGVGDDFGYFKTTIFDLAVYLAEFYQGNKAIISLGTSTDFAAAEAGAGSNFISYMVEGISSSDSANQTMLADLVNRALQESVNAGISGLYGGFVDEFTEMYVRFDNWDSVGNDFQYDVDIKILPPNFDDQYENNDDIANAHLLEFEAESSLCIYAEDPDFFKVYLNEGEDLEVEIDFLIDGADLDLVLYGPDLQQIAFSNNSFDTFVPNENILIENVSTAGWYYIEVVINDEFGWNMYDLTVSNLGGNLNQNSDDLRFVLEWNQEPFDLDLWLITPEFPGSTTYSVYWDTRSQYAADAIPYATLDVDDTNGFGPETITIYQTTPGTYQLSVYNFSSTPALAGSGATVTIFDNLGWVQSVTVPETGNGRWWQVLQLDGETGQFNVLNQLADVSTPAGSGGNAN